MPRKTAEEWRDAALERSLDADALMAYRQSSVGIVYLAGYVIELNLKSLLAQRGEDPPRTHNLRRLWRRAGLKLSDLGDRKGAKTFFLEDWNTSMRYEAQISTTFTVAELLDAAKKVAGKIHQECRRQRRRPRRAR